MWHYKFFKKSRNYKHLGFTYNMHIAYASGKDSEQSNGTLSAIPFDYPFKHVY